MTKMTTSCSFLSKVLAVLFCCSPFVKSEQVNFSEVCSLKEDSGPCFASFPRWFFNTESQQCEQFTYGGCLGNNNRFMTKADCEEKCKNQSQNDADQPCFDAVRKAFSPILVHGEPLQESSDVPYCDEQGYFLPKQCKKTSKECWCVDKLGREIKDTRTNGDRNC